MSSKQNIVIIGGGGIGTAIARQLSQTLPAITSNYNLILVTHREVHVHLPAILRMLVTTEGDLENMALIPYDSLLVNNFGTIKIGKAIGIETNSNGAGGDVLLEGGEKLAYRFLVVATGSLWEGALATLSGKKEEFLSSVRTWRVKIQKSKAVAIIGAGSVGLEIAGEIRDIYPEKEITIVNASPLPLNDTYPEKFRKDVLKRWRDRGIKFILEDRVDEIPEDEFSSIDTAKGQKVKADVVLLTRGPRPNTDLLKSLGDNVLDDRGYVLIEPTLQLAGHPDIFAGGDIIAVKEQKQLAKAPGHVAVIIANLVSLIKGAEPKKKYKTALEGIFITNGTSHGAGYVGTLWGLTFGDKVVPMVKGKGLFVSQTRASLGITS